MRATPPARSDPHAAEPTAGQATDADNIDTVADAVVTASRLLVAISARSIASADESITLPQFRLLMVLHTRGPLKLVALADHLAVNPSTASRMVQRLVTADLVTRWAHPTSRREHALGLTASGSALVRQVTERRRTEITRILRRMPAETRNGLVDALTEFARAGGEPPIASGQDPLWG
jgi:DNA-binding MarR family transcriptional regulator